MRPVVIDFETLPIEGTQPPEPVGVAIFEPGSTPQYYDWGHRRLDKSRYHPRPVSARKSAALKLQGLFRDRGAQLIFHNAAFDVRVAVHHMGCEYPQPGRVDDTEWLAFLYDPNAPKLSLKPLAERLLGEPPDEQDTLNAWIRQKLLTTAGKKRLSELHPGVTKRPAAFIAYAPAKIVAPYAIGDVTRTWGLYEYLRPRITAWGQDSAYARYQRVFPVLCRMIDRGFHVDTERAAAMAEALERDLDASEERISKVLKTDHWRTPRTLRDALRHSGMMDTRRWSRYVTAKTGELSTSTKVIARCCKDPGFAELLSLHARMAFAKTTFVDKFAAAPGGVFHADWRMTRFHGEAGQKGARTGRLASSPNVQNISGRVEVVQGLQMPAVRSLIVPRPGHRFADADYSQQELRILAHYAGGAFADAYQANPSLDMHAHAGLEIQKTTGYALERKYIKNLWFGVIYRSGNAKRAEQLGLDEENPEVIEDMKTLKASLLKALPDVNALLREFDYNSEHHATTALLEEPELASIFSRTGKVEIDPVYTIGGRICFIEPALVDDEGDVLRTWAYKLVNTAVQGSAGDQLLEAMVLLDQEWPDCIDLTVHDQTLLSLPKGLLRRKATQQRIRDIMEVDTSKGLDIDIPMKIDLEVKDQWG